MKIWQNLSFLTSIIFLLNCSYALAGHPASFKSLCRLQKCSKSSSEKSISVREDEKIEFKEVAAIGVQEGDSNYVFYQLRDVEVDNDGNIYLLDIKDYSIRKYDKSGKFILSIGGKGQGPGEMLLPQKIDIDSQGNIVLFDAAKQSATVYDSKGNYITSIQGRSAPFDGIVDGNGHIYMHYTFEGKLIHKFEIKGNHVLSFADEKKTNNMALLGHLNTGRIAFTPDREIVLGLISPYALYFYTPAGKLKNKVINKTQYDKPPFLLQGGAKITPFWIADLSAFGNYVFALVGCLEIPSDIKNKLEDPAVLQKLAEGIESYVDVIDINGGLVVHHKLPGLSWGATFDNEGNYYVVSDLPFPRMIKYRVIKLVNPNNATTNDSF